MREQTIAVEYFTHSYSSEQIESKTELQRNFDAVWQVCDNATTAERVHRITGEPATVLR